MHLYELARDYAELERLAEHGELDPKMVADTLEGLEGDIQAKTINVAKFIRNLRVIATAKRDAGKAMLAGADRLDKRADSLEQYVLANLQFIGLRKVESPELTVAIRLNPPSVTIDNEELIPALYWTQPEPPAPRVDKVHVKDDLKAGVEVPGAHLLASERLEIRE